MNTDARLTAALDYLRERKLYALDPDSRFKYVPAHSTDVRRTIEDERICLRAIDFPPLLCHTYNS